MLTKFVDEATADAITASSLTDYAAAIARVLVGGTLRIKFNGEEVAGKDGKNNWFKATVNFPPFAENTTVNPTGLTFDPTTDVKRLSPAFANPTATNTAGNKQTDDLPF